MYRIRLEVGGATVSLVASAAPRSLTVARIVERFSREGSGDPIDPIRDRTFLELCGHDVTVMAFDRTPPAPTLAHETIETIRKEMSRSLTSGSHTDGLGALLCTAAAEARAKGIQAESLLVILKDLWYSLPEIQAAASRGTEQALLQDLISRCIQEYYAL